MKDVWRDLLNYAPAKILPSIFNFAALALFARILKPAAYGNYILVITTVSIASAFFITWLSQSNVRLYDKYSGEYDRKIYVSTNVLFFIFLLSVLVFIWIVIIYFKAVELDIELRYLFLVGTPYLFAESLFAFTSGFLRAQRNSKIYMKQNIVKSFLSIIVSLLLIHVYNCGAECILIVYSVIGLFFSILVLYRLNLQWPIKFNQFSLVILKKSIKYGIPLSLTSLASYALTLSDRYFIEAYFGSMEVGIYSAGYRLAEMSIGLFSGLLIFSAFPILINVYETQGQIAAQLMISRLSRIYIVTLGPVLLIMMLFSREIAVIVFGEEYTATSSIIPIISIGVFINGIAQYTNKAFELKEKTKYLFFLLTFSASITVFLNFVLIPKYGFLGASYAVIVGYIAYFLLSMLISSKILPWIIPFDSIVKSFFSLVVLYISYRLLISCNYSLAIVIMRVLVVVFLYCCMLYFLKESTIIDFTNYLFRSFKKNING